MMMVKLPGYEMLIHYLQQGLGEKQVFVPVSEEGKEGHVPLGSLNKVDLAQMTALTFQEKPLRNSIKSLFFPDTETYLTYRKEEGRMVMETPGEMMSQILVGAKACDLESLNLIDRVFLADPVDTLYAEKRAKTLILAAPCRQQGTYCRCESFGVDRINPAADVTMYQETADAAEPLYLKSLTPAGETFLEEMMKCGTEGEAVAVTEIPWQAVPPGEKPLSPQEVKDQMDTLFEHPLWEELAMRCLGCATCTYYCPTCHCYDIRDFSRQGQEAGERYRTWDSCMFTSFTNMAGGHNPRPHRKDRIQNRFFHKLNYFVKKQGPLACVGCGRCGDACPVGISMDTVLNRIGGDRHDA
ncbi:4Fe-4S dicluster domain-containing protein [Anoxynatronum buryatiense]|uniref:4Fe-4S dicluster containing protein n=1 Tax=Anoxynatronum buryatiense TaxID=489973 RepID=A0AA45WYJ1_9CLOT|nr:4Fe-4S dicluster domain-containing protein [Anoxynatronum buryatiense]SMP69243.1 4Fe-4S dicluster containing protein [Anoxynatronum buryatiense]